MADLATFANGDQLLEAIRGKSKTDIMRDADEAGVDLILQKVFMGMMMTFDGQRAAGRNAIIQYDIQGPKQLHRYQVTVKDGQCTIQPEGKAIAHVTFKLSLANFLKLMTNTLNPMFALLFRQMKIKGSMQIAGELKGWFSKRPPT